MIIKVYDANNIQSVDVELEGVSENNYHSIVEILLSSLQTHRKSDAVARAYLYALSLCPDASPADLWWHTIYRTYLKHYSDQSWKRTAGYALEEAFVQFYDPLLAEYGIRMYRLDDKNTFNAMEYMGIANQIGKSKLDVGLSGICDDGTFQFFGGVHVKSSLAERIQDDVPASIAMMEAGYWSGFFTLDAKAFPPPHGDGVVRGELGYRSDPQGALKRNYFERDGQFDNCYSYNLQTIPSSGPTHSGKRIYVLSFSDSKPDQFMKDVIERWYQAKKC